MYGYLQRFWWRNHRCWRGSVVLGGEWSSRQRSLALRWSTMLNNDPLLLTRLDAVFRIERTLGAWPTGEWWSIHRKIIKRFIPSFGNRHRPHCQCSAVTNQMPRPMLTSTVLVLNKHLSVAEVRRKPPAPRRTHRRGYPATVALATACNR
jgi:hypothetical protein